MDYEQIITNFQKDFKGKVWTLNSEEKKHLLDKDTPRGRMFGFLTMSYYKRLKLFEEGTFTYAYCFKTWNNSYGSDRPYPVWFIFSPESYFNKNRNELEKIAAKLGKFVKDFDCKKDKKHKKLFTMLNEYLSEPNYIELPFEFTDNHLIYLHVTYLRPLQNPHFNLGYNVVVFSKGISKEVLFVPEMFWNKEYKETYLKIKVETNLLK